MPIADCVACALCALTAAALPPAGSARPPEVSGGGELILVGLPSESLPDVGPETEPAVAAAAIEPETAGDGRQRVAERVRLERERLLEEIEGIAESDLPEDHWAREWAGEYSCGDGRGMNVRITVGPSGFVYTWHGCLGLYDWGYGRILGASDDGLRLWFVDRQEDGMDFLTNDLYFVRWGERRYLTPEDELREFIEEYNHRDARRYMLIQMPEREQPGAVRRWDRPTPTVAPRLPERFAPLLEADAGERGENSADSE